MDYSIRPYSKADFLFLGTLSNDDEYKSQHLPIALSLQKADERTERCFVATVDNKIVGYIYGYIVPGRVTLPQFLYVKNENRRGGIGAALLKRFEDESQTPCSLIYYNFGVISAMITGNLISMIIIYGTINFFGIFIWGQLIMFTET